MLKHILYDAINNDEESTLLRAVVEIEFNVGSSDNLTYVAESMRHN